LKEKVSGTFWSPEPVWQGTGMGRPRRVDVGGYLYHVLNRARAWATLFERPADYRQFEDVLEEAVRRTPMRLLAYCVMPNHWHLVLWPERDGLLTRCMTWLTLTHTQRWHARRGSAGSGHLYQGRYKAFLVQADDHLLTVCRYVEHNPLRAGLVGDAEAWRWGSLWRRERGRGTALLAEWPVERPADWRAIVNRAQTPAELEVVRQAVRRGRPFGREDWREQMVRRFELGSTLRPRGRPGRGPSDVAGRRGRPCYPPPAAPMPDLCPWPRPPRDRSSGPSARPMAAGSPRRVRACLPAYGASGDEAIARVRALAGGRQRRVQEGPGSVPFRRWLLRLRSW
jgi:putative transposase